MSYKKLDLVQGSPEWLSARYNYVTASQVPILFSLSPYQTPLGLFEEKTQQRETLDKTGKEVLFQRGHNAEAAGRDYLREKMNLDFHPAVLASKEYPLLASLDGHIEKDGQIFEAKFVGKDVLAEIRKGNIPPHHACQIQAALLVSKADTCFYFATDPSGDSHLLTIYPDSNYQALIVEAAKNFWDLVAKGQPPEMTDQDFFQVDGDVRFEKLQLLDAEIKRMEKEFDSLRLDVISSYKDHARVRAPGVTIIKSVKKGSIEYAKIPVLKGIDLEKFRKPSTEVVTVRFEKPKALRGVA